MALDMRVVRLEHSPGEFLVDGHDLQVGDKVKIVDEWLPTHDVASGGWMDRWLGQVMTVLGFYDYRVLMEEDVGECSFHSSADGHWFWALDMIDHVIDGSNDTEQCDDCQDEQFLSMIGVI